MSVNKNAQQVDHLPVPEPTSGEASRRPEDHGTEAGGPVVVLDDLAPQVQPRSLAASDLKLLRALQSILEKRQTDAWIEEMAAQISVELEWNEP
jgi:hypothetical protein